ncbi:hypothetical protein C0584_03810 [Candidatus Parcubacteria bacterium]|nr:MAG: hypothetical protein C0584_03810 [Candidatus Parcubacteria bacterium]
MLLSTEITILIFALILSFSNFYSRKFSKLFIKHKFQILSFGAGNLIALIFLILLPEILKKSELNIVLFLLLLGFTFFHVLEKFLYQHNHDRKKLYKELKYLHQIGFFVDHFMIGFILSSTLNLDSNFKFFILVPLFLQTISSSFSLEYMDKREKTKFNKMILSSAPFVGALSSISLNVEPHIKSYLFAFIMGMLLYIISRDIIPKKKRGNPFLFLLGVSLITIIWLNIK